MQKRLIVLFILLGLATVYSLISLQVSDNDESLSYTDYGDSNSSKQNHLRSPLINGATQAESDTHLANSDTADNLQSETSEDKGKTLPFYLKLVGISDQQHTTDDSSQSMEISVMLQFENQLHTHTLLDYIGDSDIQIVEIQSDSINVNYEDDIYTIDLTQPNLLATNFADIEPSDTELLQMSANDISTRPRMVEHLVTLTATPYIADGKIVSAGMNPELFEQAGFKVDDVLKTINGKRVTVDDEYEEIQKEIKTATTLTFVVMRRGRLITLYLDIPSETLEFVAD